jgi:hypothetical protein
VCFVGTKRQAKSVLEARVARRQDALRHRALAGRHAHQLPHHSLAPQAPRRTRSDRANDNFASYSKKMESQLKREKMKIKRNLEGIRHMEKLPGALVVVDVRSRADRAQGSPQARHPDDLLDRHRRRSRTRGHRDPRQRRLDAFHRRGRPRVVPRGRRGSPAASGADRSKASVRGWREAGGRAPVARAAPSSGRRRQRGRPGRR